jgi:protein SCO1/2
MKRISILIGLVVVLGAILISMILFVTGSRPPALHGTYLEPPLEAADFELTSADGRISKSSYEGRLVVLFFGYTLCPDVCPTTMSRLRRTMEILGSEADQIQVIMVSVDPERDTPENVSSYARAFNRNFIGLTGTQEEIDRVAADYGIFHAKAEGSANTTYLVDHTAAVMVLDRNGDTRLIWSFEITPEEMAEDLRYLVENV